jgi:hypothetical protein
MALRNVVEATRHRGIIWLGVSVIVGLGLFPPWRYVVIENGITITAGYAPLFEPPGPILRIKDFPTIAETIAAKRVVEGGLPDRAAALQREYPPQIDYERLLLQWLLAPRNRRAFRQRDHGRRTRASGGDPPSTCGPANA